ncbi:MAG: hypothetical protein EON47_07780 [Acetobacteraceae bacterium]|nr:MAG: hypothetical protein EON47_07780 [Acetobacteraceae bacterium]
MLVAFPALLPGAPGGVRTSELAAVLALTGLGMSALWGQLPPPGPRPAGIAFLLCLPWIGAELVATTMQDYDRPAQMMLVRWVMSLASGYALAALMGWPEARRPVSLGLLAGLLLSFGSIVLDHVTFDPAHADFTVVELEQFVWVNGVYRATGIFSHPNAAAGTVLLAVPLVIGLVEERLLPRLSLLLAVGVIGGVFAITQTRGPTAFAVLLLLLHLVRRGAAMRRALAFGGVALLLLLLADPLQSPGQGSMMQRLMDADNIQAGASDRIDTVLASLELALSHPLGLGSAYVAELEARTGFSATHNGILQLALTGGLPIAILVVAMLTRHAGMLLRRPAPIEAWTAAYLIGALLFENQFFVPTFAVLTIWLLWLPRRAAA